MTDKREFPWSIGVGDIVMFMYNMTARTAGDLLYVRLKTGTLGVVLKCPVGESAQSQTSPSTLYQILFAGRVCYVDSMCFKVLMSAS